MNLALPWKKQLPAPVRANLPAEVAVVPPRASYSWEQGGLGVVSPFFVIPQTQNLFLYEQLVKMIPALSAAIKILCQLVGCPKPVSDDEAALEELNEWWMNVSVNQMQTGGANFFPSHCKDHLIYGRAHMEALLSARGREVMALQPLHPRTIELKPRQGRYGVDLVQRTGFLPVKPLTPPELFFTSIHDPEQDSPQGCSILASLPFVAGILNKMLAALGETWERYGAPSYVVVYRPAKEISDPNGTQARAVVSEALLGLERAQAAKAEGRTRDFGAAGDFSIEILGAAGEALDIEVPGRLILEQINSVFGLPPWMLGYHWSTTERLSREQALLLGENVDEMREHLGPTVLKIWQLRQAFVGRPIEDLGTEWEAPSLVDQLAEAQAKKAEAEAGAAKLKHSLELSRLGMKEMWEIAREQRDDLEGKSQAEVEAALPRLLAEPPPVQVTAPAGPLPSDGGGPPFAANPFGRSRSVTYGEPANGRGH